jgi:two-component system sensor histidine kinase SenX3
MPLTATDATALALACAIAGVGVVAVVLWRRRLVRRLRPLVEALSRQTTLGPSAPIADVLEEIERAARLLTAECSSTGSALERLSEALSTVPQGVIVADRSGHVIFRNATATSFAGARHGDAIVEVAVAELLAAALAGVHGSGRTERQLELYGPPKRTLQLRAQLLGRAGSLGAVAMIEDISQRRRLEAVRSDFIANVSHELKTPVGALGILAEAMLGEDDPAVVRRLAARMNAEAFRVGRIIDDLLDLSRIESEDSPPRHDEVLVDDVVAEALERVGSLAEHRAISITVTTDGSRWAVVGDSRQLASAVHNLLDNAVKYSDPGGPVEVKVGGVGAGPDSGTRVEISVRDLGLGIPPADLGRIFERFYRVDRARARQTGGTGLGLAIVRHVATNHGGDVRVTSREGEGSVFTLSLPAVAAVAVPTVADAPAVALAAARNP